MTTLATLVAFGTVIAITAEAVRYRQAWVIAAKDQRIRQLEADLAKAQEWAQNIAPIQGTWSPKEWNR